MLSGMLTSSGEWDWGRLEHILPASVLDTLAADKPPRPQYGPDAPGWRWDERRRFTLASAYRSLLSDSTQLRDPKRRIIWALRVPQRIRVFMWITAHKWYLTNVELVRRHISLSDGCSICFKGVEDIEHVLWKCTKAHELWYNVLRSDKLDSFMSTPFDDWLLINLRHKSGPVNPEIVWKGPDRGWVKVNVDASVNSTDNQALIGGLIRDDSGGWVLGFYGVVGRCSLLLAEMWAIHEGLCRAWDTGCRRVEVETDSKEAACIVNRVSHALAGSALVQAIWTLMRQEWLVQVWTLIQFRL
ncbi:hypothetical protein V6N12_031327 [Hibiscus sabdariffa]|uniref:Uncharacterized protein n=1 Tax=Hibiscus sabdariffa TaxID=183260 RepID=A0ABR2E8M8_9ROSI